MRHLPTSIFTTYTTEFDPIACVLPPARHREDPRGKYSLQFLGRPVPGPQSHVSFMLTACRFEKEFDGVQDVFELQVRVRNPNACTKTNLRSAT